ncbi:hypothetical protein BDZ89DRAFT_1062890 [Hymenopellis radicata]|nr:hypothetical protein BDZ89DRAFT_1062890 [Hymenopellis radicata]
MADCDNSDMPLSQPAKRNANSPPPTPPSPVGSEAEVKSSRKREREVSQEPATLPTPTEDGARDLKEIRAPKKKNRLQLDSTAEEDDSGSRSRSSSPTPAVDSPPQEMKIRVRQISQGVEDLNWRNMHKSDDDLPPKMSVDGQTVPEETQDDNKMDVPVDDSPASSSQPQSVNDPQQIPVDITLALNGTHSRRDSDSDSGEREKGLKRKYPERGPSQGPPENDAVPETSKRPRDDADKDDNPRETKRPSPPPDAPVKPAKKLGGFMAYAATKSPFSAVKGPNIFASASSSTSALPPSTAPSPFAAPVLGQSSKQTRSLPASTEASFTLPPSSLPSSPAKKSGFSAFATTGSPFKASRSKSPPRKNASGAKNAFSAYKGAGVHAFAVPAFKVTRAGSPSPSSQTPESGGEDEPNTFGDKLRAGRDDSDEDDGPKLNLTEQDRITGEEEEDTMFSVRCKLFALDGQAWKERGVGVLKVNVHKTTNRARILMRKEAVHTTLLNVSLFHGMSCSIAQDPRYLRLSVIEKGEGTQTTHFNLRLSNASVTQDLLNNIRDRIPDA